MDNISEFLYLGFATALFCLGIYLFFQGYNEYNVVLKNVSEKYDDNYLLSQQVRLDEGTYSTIEKSEDYYSKGYIMALLFEPLEYDIQIDGLLINKHFHDKSKIRGYELSKDLYKKQYMYDSKGNISKIKFTGE